MLPTTRFYRFFHRVFRGTFFLGIGITLLLSSCQTWSPDPSAKNAGPTYNGSPESSTPPIGDPIPDLPLLPPGDPHYRMAILLPLTGPYATAVSSLAEGISEAWENLPSEERPQLRFIDTHHERPAEIHSALQSAIQQGVDGIIGPLTPHGVEAAIHAPSPRAIPMVVLHETPYPLPAHMYAMGMGGETELHHMVALGRTRKQAVIVSPDQPIKRQEAQRLAQYWRAATGSAAQIGYYAPGDADALDQLIHQVLQLPPDTRAHRAGSRGPASRPPTPPAAILHNQVIFTLGSSHDVMLMKPLMNYYGGATIPVIGRSYLIPTADPGPYTDLNGIQYCDMPATLSRGQARFHAFGQDAWQAARWLLTGDPIPNRPWLGQTGIFTLHRSNHHLIRRLVCYQVVRGHPTPLPIQPSP